MILNIDCQKGTLNKKNEFFFPSRRIVVSKSFTPEFVCEFNFQLFPFDSQECYIEMIHDGTDAKFVELMGDTLIFNGPENVNEYRLEAPSMIKAKGNSIKILVKFTRLPFKSILTILLPTMLINLVREII